MFYELYRDQDVTRGGLWFDPDDNDMIEVIDMEEATGDKGVIFVEKGDLYVTEEKLRRAVESSGHFHEEAPPAPPSGRKRWLSVPWDPPPAPGYLFWMPKPLLGPKILEAWEIWTNHLDEGGKFEDLPEEIQELVLRGAEAMHSYSGIRGDSRSRVVIAQHPGAKRKKEDQYPDAIIARNPEAAVWRILKEMGVRKDA